MIVIFLFLILPISLRETVTLENSILPLFISIWDTFGGTQSVPDSIESTWNHHESPRARANTNIAPAFGTCIAFFFRTREQRQTDLLFSCSSANLWTTLMKKNLVQVKHTPRMRHSDYTFRGTQLSPPPQKSRLNLGKPYSTQLVGATQERISFFSKNVLLGESCRVFYV